MTTDIYAQLAKIQAQRKVLEAQEQEIKVAILTEMQDTDVTTVTNKYGKFTVSARKSYTYSEAVDKLAEKLKIAKYKEEQKGIAKAKETIYLTYTGVKKD